MVCAMCGRAYSTVTQEELSYRYLNKRPLKLDGWRETFNLAPTQPLPVVFQDQEGERQIELFRWGLVPTWAKDRKIGSSLINARSETVAEKPSFRSAFKSRRCLVPLSGFFEWSKRGESKTPYRVSFKDDPIMTMAGIHEHWKDPESGELLNTFAIITTHPNAALEPFHDRQPVTLDEEGQKLWLSAEAQPDALKGLLVPCPSTWLEIVEISKLVNSPRNNRPEVLEPAAAARGN